MNGNIENINCFGEIKYEWCFLLLGTLPKLTEIYQSKLLVISTTRRWCVCETLLYVFRMVPEETKRLKLDSLNFKYIIYL